MFEYSKIPVYEDNFPFFQNIYIYFIYYFREDDEAQEYLQEVYERLDELGADTAESKASHILLGLQFDAKMQQKKCKDFSGKSMPTIY